MRAGGVAGGACKVMRLLPVLQVSIPAARVGGLPVGLGLIGPAGSDEALLQIACRLADSE